MDTVCWSDTVKHVLCHNVDVSGGSGTNLMRWHATGKRHVAHPALCHHHALGSSEPSEGRVGWQVGFTQVTCATHVWDIVGVLHME